MADSPQSWRNCGYSQGSVVTLSACVSREPALAVIVSTLGMRLMRRLTPQPNEA
jgi:predicted esterase